MAVYRKSTVLASVLALVLGAAFASSADSAKSADERIAKVKADLKMPT